MMLYLGVWALSKRLSRILIVLTGLPLLKLMQEGCVEEIVWVLCHDGGRIREA